MLEYTNGFSCAVNPLNEEVIINFGQQVPIYDDDGNVIDVSIEEVVALAMSRSTAKRLIDSLSELLDGENE